MTLIYLALLSGLIATSFVPKSEARLHAESIVGGSTAHLSQHAYSVSIQCNGEHFCGGAILNNLYIITAAHCFIDDETNRSEIGHCFVVAGVQQAHNRQEPYREVRQVATVYIPRNYSPRGNRVADIAVLALRSALGLNQFITHVDLPHHMSHMTFANERAVVSGYGHNWVAMRNDPHNTYEVVEVCSGSYCFERRFAQVDILSNNACNNFFGDRILDSQFCGHMRQRSVAEPEGLCTGDSGSPLVMDDTIIGIVSVSPEGCRENVEPALYTRVTSFMPFIINAMNGVHTANMRVMEY